MNNQSWRIERLKYCRIENTPDGVKYYGVVGKELIEVSKDVYHVLERSYHKEWKMDLDRNRENHTSYDQLAEEIASADYHNTVPPSLQYRSTEEEYFDEEDLEAQDVVPEEIAEEFNQLNEREKQLLFTYTSTSGIKAIAKKENVSTRTIYRHRQRIATRIRTAYQMRRQDHE